MSDKRDDAIYLELLTKISDEVRETRNLVNSLDKKIDLNIQRTEFELKNINRLDEHQNQLLAEHIAGVNTLKQIFDSTQEVNEVRLQKLEEPKKWLTTTYKVILVAGGLATAVLAILKFFHKI